MIPHPYYSKRGVWTLFLLSAFAPHLWTILMVLRDFGWVSERTNVWDAVGVGAYGLLIAFVESVFVFTIAFLLGFLMTRYWDERTRIALLSVLLLVVAWWEVCAQLYFIWGMSVPEEVIQMLASTEHPLRNLYAVVLIFVVPPVLILVYWVIFSEKIVQAITALMERITLLVSLYLLLDIAALVIVMLRNLHKIL